MESFYDQIDYIIIRYQTGPKQQSQRIAIAAAIAVLVWLRTRDRLGFLFLSVPFGVRIYILAKQLAHWRFIILGFFVLAAGAIMSLKKSTRQSSTEQIVEGKQQT